MDIKTLADLGRRDEAPQTLAMAYAAQSGHSDPIAQAIAYDDTLARRRRRRLLAVLLIVFGILVAGAVLVMAGVYGNPAVNLLRDFFVTQFIAGFVTTIAGFIVWFQDDHDRLPDTADAEGFAADLTLISQWCKLSPGAFRSMSPLSLGKQAEQVLCNQAMKMLRHERAAEKASGNEFLEHVKEALEEESVFFVMLETFFRYGLTDLDMAKGMLFAAGSPAVEAMPDMPVGTGGVEPTSMPGPIGGIADEDKWRGRS